MSDLSKDPLLQPLQLGKITIRNRVMSTSHACGLQEDGLTKERYQRYHLEKAKGGIGLSMFGGSSNVDLDSPNVFQQLYVGDDRCIPYFQEFSERMHGEGASLMCQITHLGRRGESYVGDWLPTIAPSAIRETLHRSFPKEMDEDDIARVIRAFGDAAWRCKEGGLDGLETHAGPHLLGQFLSPITNKRQDKFGGSLENRCRFGLMVYEEMRRRVGPDFLLGFRYTIDEDQRGGLSFDDCLTIAKIFAESGTVDFFNAIYGRMDTSEGLAVKSMPGMASTMAPWLKTAALFKQEIGLPVFHAARIADIATARYAISEGLLDMVGMTRAHIADPHIIRKIEAGEEERIRPCVGMTHCMSPARPVCAHNAATGRETSMKHSIEPSPPPRRAVVVGGGPGGLEAARILALRGHEVTLLEAAAQVGGQLQLAKTASWRKDVIGIIDWRVAELARLGVEVRVNCYAEADEVMALSPDLVIVATGGLPLTDLLEGEELVTSVWDSVTGETGIEGEEILVYDGTGRHGAMTAAERLAMAGRNVSLYAIDDSLAPEMAYSERVIWKKRAYQLSLPCHFDRRLIAVRRDGNRLVASIENEMTGEVAEVTTDRVVVEQGTMPADSLYQDLAPSARNKGVTNLAALKVGRPQPTASSESEGVDLYRIGDCVASRNVAAAIYDAHRLCQHL